MAVTLQELIDRDVAEAMKREQATPGCLWAQGGIEDDRLSREDVHVFGIKYDDYPRMLATWYLWYDFLGLTEATPEDEVVLKRERKRLRRLHAIGNEPGAFMEFARAFGGLTHRQAEAMYCKDWFWVVRNGHVTYADEILERANARSREGAGESRGEV